MYKAKVALRILYVYACYKTKGNVILTSGLLFEVITERVQECKYNSDDMSILVICCGILN